MIRKQFPDYELADNSILHYRDMKLVTFSIDREMHSLIISFPMFVKDFRQPPLNMKSIQLLSPYLTETGRLIPTLKCEIRSRTLRPAMITIFN